ncbi:MAG: vitamin B12-dependent ribonucleotide reductase [Dehalococcoidia bacterium]|nr:vitamin B12-dependent ribonucleotide reductase [Dehalococcoidia bacterium]
MARQKRTETDSTVTEQNIARAVFSAAESVGVNDRKVLEQFAEKVSQNLGVAQPLPGMEALVPAEKERHHKRPPSPAVPRPPLKVLPTYHAVEKDSELHLSDNALRVLERRYLAKDADGKAAETPAAMFRRVAHHIASAEVALNPKADVAAWEEQFYDLMTNLDFLPNSPTLMNAGRELGQLSACFVLPVEDSMESIFDAVKHTALIHKSGGGTGFSFSRLRPEKDRVGSTGGVASGPLSFMHVFDKTTDVIKQGGMRRGANMAILNVNHPDIQRFISIKKGTGILTNFNLSVGVSDDFMQAVREGAEFALVSPRTGEVFQRVSAQDLFDQIVDMAWLSGDPGVVFLDEINRHNPTPQLGKIESTNPCGEQPLLPYESCNLGSINLAHMVSTAGTTPQIDFERIAEVVHIAVRFLDNVIEVNSFPLPEIRDMTRSTRKIGLGLMGFADMLMLLGIPYDSEEALIAADDVMAFVESTANAASIELATERGVFPAFTGSAYDVPNGPRYRNASRTTIAPTGSLSILANCSSGIEPVFGLTYVRHILDKEEFLEVNPLFEQVAREQGFYSDDLMRALAEGKSLRGMDDIPEDVKRTFVCAYDISPDWHVRMQASFQRHTDSAVSKTVNFPHDATREDVANVYLLAYKEALKGITIYRDGSRDDQVLTTGVQKPEEKPEQKPSIGPRSRPKVTRGVTERVSTGCGNMYVTINFDDHGPCEAFATLGKAGGCAAAQLEATSRLISNALRSGLDLASIVKNLKGIRCPSISWEQGHAITSCADAIAGVLEKYIDEGTTTGQAPRTQGLSAQCPECGGTLIHQEGCSICTSCGYTKCS